MIQKTIGICFVLLGLLWSIFERYLCMGLCRTCDTQQLSPCFFLFLFVGIIFIVVGASITLSTNLIEKQEKNKN